MESNYIVSARKYRPATFRSVVGQSHITTTLQSSIAKGQLAHAYLFTGPRGVGKTTCARIFAKTINCQNPTPQHEACGECESCRSFDEGRSWGIHELDAASNNSVEDIRALIEKVRIPPQVGRYSVYIIDEVHMLSAAAFNAFLKTLEEPPHYAVFILATTEKHKILPTILSRCQSYDFRRIGTSDIVEYLEYVAKSEGISYDDESLNIIAMKADGGMRDALSTFDRVVSYCGGNITFEKAAESVGALDFNTYFNAVQMAAAEDYAQLLLLYDSTLRAGFDGQIFVNGLSDHLRNLVVAKNAATQTLLDVTGTLKERYVSQAASLELGWIMNAMALITAADSAYRTATNRRLHVELALMKLCGLKKKDSELTIADSFALPAVTIGGATLVATAVATSPNPANTATPQSTTQTNTQPAQQTAIVSQPAAQSESPAQQIPPTNTKIEEKPLPPVAAQEKSGTLAKTEGKPVKRQKISITGISINSSIGDNNELSDQEREQQLGDNSGKSPEEVEKLLAQGWLRVTDFWQQMGRPRIATAMSIYKIHDGRMTIMVANETLREELLQSKLDIEATCLKLLGVRPNFEVEITEQKLEYRPVSTEQKLQHLVAKNNCVAKLLNTLDLTV